MSENDFLVRLTISIFPVPSESKFRSYVKKIRKLLYDMTTIGAQLAGVVCVVWFGHYRVGLSENDTNFEIGDYMS